MSKKPKIILITDEQLNAALAKAYTREKVDAALERYINRHDIELDQLRAFKAKMKAELSDLQDGS